MDYYDFHLMHTQNAETIAFFINCKANETALELKAESKFGHFGISFHDTADVMKQILTEYPQIEVVQIQFNNWNTDYYYNNVYTTRNGKASNCIKCGK